MESVISGTEFNYRVDKEYGINHDGFIAEGTESIVFKGIKYGNELKYSCALKFKPKSRLRDFMDREYKILESLHTCRSVVRVLDVIEDLGDFILPYNNGEINKNNFFCVVEEFIDGDSLQDYCIKQWFNYNLSHRQWERNNVEYSYREIVKFQNQIIQFMINLCEIMKFVSNVNDRNGKTDPNKPKILHCDIKPENIMVTKHGKELVLIDFGRSQQIIEGNVFQYYNKPSDKLFSADYSDEQWQDVGKDNLYTYGTVGYAAPECYALASGGIYPFRDQEKNVIAGCISTESDIFGLGATFWECLSIYEICMNIFENAKDLSDPRLFNHNILKLDEGRIRSGEITYYCDRDFRSIDVAFHEALEDILRKCTHTRNNMFQSLDMPSDEYYHNYHELQRDIERARDAIPSLDRKSDPLVRQMLGAAGFCASFAVCFFSLWFLLLVFSNTLARDRWNILVKNYTDNQKKTTLASVATDMLTVPGQKRREKNYNDILNFMYSGAPNDYVIDFEEAELLTSLLKEHISDKVVWGRYVDEIIQHAKSDNMDEIAQNVYRLNLPEESESNGYILARALVQVNDSDDRDVEKLIPAYNTIILYADQSEYKTIISKLAIKLMSGKKIETIASELQMDRESIRESLSQLTEMEGED